MGHPSLSHSFRRMPRGGVEQENYGLLCSKVADLVLPNISDRWCWSLEGTQEFSVKSSRILIDNTILPKAEVPTRWLRVVPIKVNFHAWRICLDKLPTRANISLRGMDIPSIACPLCNSAERTSATWRLQIRRSDTGYANGNSYKAGFWLGNSTGESCSHLLFSCNMARILINKVAHCWELDIPDLLSYEEWLDWFKVLRLPKGIKDILEGLTWINPESVLYDVKSNMIAFEPILFGLAISSFDRQLIVDDPEGSRFCIWYLVFAPVADRWVWLLGYMSALRIADMFVSTWFLMILPRYTTLGVRIRILFSLVRGCGLLELGYRKPISGIMSISDKSKGKQIKDVPIVQDFPEVFPEDLSGLPPTRLVEF
ncbi:RNA-directed DNA polymerase, eukaryota [Tanacetum coccineum]